MRRRRHLLERIYGQFAEGEKPLNAGNDVAQTCRQLEIAVGLPRFDGHGWLSDYATFAAA